MRECIVYHNPGCSKSRRALELLAERGVPIRIIEYLRTPPDRDELRGLRERLGLPVERWIRSGEQAYAAEGLSAQSSEQTLLAAIERHPILLERPIAVCGERAVVGRPPERVLELLEEA